MTRLATTPRRTHAFARASGAALLLAACSFQPTTSGAQDAVPHDSDHLHHTDAAPDGPCFGPDTDGDGLADSCDPCPADNPNDTDGDGVCNSVDRCPAGDDHLDADSDGVPDACDDWPCGSKPAAPPATVTWMTSNENVTLSAVNVGGQGRLAVATPGQTLATTATYSIVDCQCPNCIDQIELGWIPGGKQACLYNGNPGGAMCSTPTTGTQTRTIVAPATVGTVYAVRFNRGNDNSCQANGAWWANVPPGAGNTVALVCVH